MTRRLVIEADGGARGNPGVAGYGAVVRDGATGRVLAERAAYLGDNVTNNVAEYSGLIAGLEAAVGLDPAAQLEVRMDSRLVVSQMAGRWKIKNADLRDLVAQARAVMGARQVRFTWVPRADNSRADALANQAMDTRGPVVWDAAEVGNPDRLGGGAGSVPVPGGVGGDGDGVVDGLFPVPDAARGSGPPAVTPAVTAAAATGGEPAAWAAAVRFAQRAKTGAQRPPNPTQPPTTVILVRHGMTAGTARNVFAGAALPGLDLSPEGRAQAEAAAAELASMLAVPWYGLERPVALLASPTARTEQTAATLAATLGLPVEPAPGFIEQDFGLWEGLTAEEIAANDPTGPARWRLEADFAPPGGETRTQVGERVKAALNQLVARWRGQTVVVVAHTMSIRAALGAALGAPPQAWNAFRIQPASISIIRLWELGLTEVVCTNRTVA